MSDFDAQTSAIFEKLYDERGQPDELDDAFIQEYFKLVKDHVKLDAEEAEIAPPPLEPTEAKLSKPERGLIELNLSAEREKYIVSRLHPVKILHGSSARIGQHRGRNRYTLINNRGFIKIVITTGTTLLLFVFPTKVEPDGIRETGSGVWVPANA